MIDSEPKGSDKITAACEELTAAQLVARCSFFFYNEDMVDDPYEDRLQTFMAGVIHGQRLAKLDVDEAGVFIYERRNAVYLFVGREDHILMRLTGREN
jgi:hypothetical protein